MLLSLFTSGLKMSVGLRDRRWFPPLRLALLSMLATVALITAAGVWLLGLPLGAAVLLGGILAPTDPVLATEVQVDNPADRDQLRFALTGEGGLNDGTAFPVVMLGLGLLGAHEIGTLGWRWLAIDVLWATGGRPRHRCRAGHRPRPARAVPAPPPPGGGGLRQLPRTRPHRAGLRLRGAGACLRLPRRVRRRSGAAPHGAGRTDAAASSLGAAPTAARRGSGRRLRGTGASQPAARRRRADRHRPAACPGLHGARGDELQRAARPHRRDGGRGDPGHAAVGGAVGAGGLVVRAAGAAAGAPAVGGRRAGRLAPHLAAAAPAHRLVRHPRHRLAVLPELRAQPRPAAGARADAGGADGGGGRELDRRARHLGDAADGAVPAARRGGNGK